MSTARPRGPAAGTDRVPVRLRAGGPTMMKPTRERRVSRQREWQITQVQAGNCAICGSTRDRKSTRLNSSHGYISYAVFCLKKKKYIDATMKVRHLGGAVTTA